MHLKIENISLAIFTCKIVILSNIIWHSWIWIC